MRKRILFFEVLQDFRYRFLSLNCVQTSEECKNLIFSHLILKLVVLVGIILEPRARFSEAM